MNEVNELLKNIEELREKMNHTISTNNDLQDDEIIKLSRLLDEYLVGYYKLLKRKTSQYSGI